MAVFDLDLLMMAAFFICFMWCYIIVVRTMFQNGSTAAAILAIVLVPWLGTLIGLWYAWTKGRAWAIRQIAGLWTCCIASFALFVAVAVGQDSIPGATSELLLKKLPWPGILLVCVRVLLTIGFVCAAVWVLRRYHSIHALVEELREKPSAEGVAKVARFGRAAVPALERIVDDDDPDVRSAAAEALRIVGSRGAGPIVA